MTVAEPFIYLRPAMTNDGGRNSLATTLVKPDNTLLLFLGTVLDEWLDTAFKVVSYYSIETYMMFKSCYLDIGRVNGREFVVRICKSAMF